MESEEGREGEGGGGGGGCGEREKCGTFILLCIFLILVT